MKRFTLRLLFRLALLLCLSGRSILAQEVKLDFDRFAPTKGTSVGFSTEDYGTLPAASIAGKPLRIQSTPAELYSLSVRTDSFGRDKFQRFSFEAYVRSAHGDEHGTVHKYVVTEDPIGPFQDAIFPITFHIEGPAGKEASTIILPLHSNDGSDNVSLAIPTEPLKVGLSGPFSSDLGLTNKLESLQVHVVHCEISSTSCSDCWLLKSANTTINFLAPQKATSLIVSLRPDTFKALGKSMFVLNPAKAHDTLVISVFSVSEQDSLPTPQEFKLPVRFTPPALYLVVAVLLGAIVGSILGALLKSRSAQPAPVGRFQRLKDVVTSVFVAVIVWIFALVLFSYTETRVLVLGFSFDPSQVIPAGLISLLVAGGTPIITKIKDAFGK